MQSIHRGTMLVFSVFAFFAFSAGVVLVGIVDTLFNPRHYFLTSLTAQEVRATLLVFAVAVLTLLALWYGVRFLFSRSRQTRQNQPAAERPVNESQAPWYRNATQAPPQPQQPPIYNGQPATYQQPYQNPYAVRPPAYQQPQPQAQPPAPNPVLRPGVPVPQSPSQSRPPVPPPPAQRPANVTVISERPKRPADLGSTQPTRPIQPSDLEEPLTDPEATRAVSSTPSVPHPPALGKIAQAKDPYEGLFPPAAPGEDEQLPDMDEDHFPTPSRDAVTDERVMPPPEGVISYESLFPPDDEPFAAAEDTAKIIKREPDAKESDGKSDEPDQPDQSSTPNSLPV